MPDEDVFTAHVAQHRGRDLAGEGTLHLGADVLGTEGETRVRKARKGPTLSAPKISWLPLENMTGTREAYGEISL